MKRLVIKPITNEVLSSVFPVIAGLFITMNLWAAQAHNPFACSAAIHRQSNETHSADKKSIRNFYAALSSAKENEPLEFNFSRSIQIICPFKNLCGVGTSSAKMEFSEWLQIMSKGQVGEQIQIQVLPEGFKVLYKKDSKNPLNIPALVEVGEGTYVPAPLSNLYLELNDTPQNKPDDDDLD